MSLSRDLFFADQVSVVVGGKAFRDLSGHTSRHFASMEAARETLASLWFNTEGSLSRQQESWHNTATHANYEALLAHMESGWIRLEHASHVATREDNAKLLQYLQDKAGGECAGRGSAVGMQRWMVGCAQ